MAERFMALVLKTSDTERYRGFESLSLRQFHIPPVLQKYPRGRRGSPAKGVGCVKRREGSNPSFCAKSTFSVIAGKVDFFYVWPMLLSGKSFPVS